MTENESKLVRQTLRGFVDSGLISEATMSEIASLKDTPTGDKPRPMNLLTRKQAAKLLGVSGQSLINWHREGKIQPIKLAQKRCVRYRLEDIENLCK